MSTGPTAQTLSDLPTDELLRLARELGLDPQRNVQRGELLRIVRRRQELLLEIDRDALLDVVIWARRPVRASASKETLAREIARIRRVDLTGLSRRGLVALARLRDVEPLDTDTDEQLARRIVAAVPLWERVREQRRQVVSSLIGRLVGRPPRDEIGEYRFLPESDLAAPVAAGGSLGIFGGVARRIKGAADTYIDAKLDEIEARVDRKLDEIDERLAEWRDREIANRLRIIRLTLIASIVVALVSLGYSAFKRELLRERAAAPTAQVENAAPAAAAP